MEVLSYRIDAGTPPKNVKADTCPSQKVFVVSAGYVLTKSVSECGVAIGAQTNGAPNGDHREAVQLAFDPADHATASPKSTCACPGGCASGTNTSRDRRFLFLT
jgi:hypothetical protein